MNRKYLNTILLQTKSELSKALNWKERLQCALKSEDEANKQNLTNSVTAFHNMLVALYNFKHTGRIFQGTVQLLKQKGDLSIDASDLALVSLFLLIVLYQLYITRFRLHYLPPKT